MNNIVPEHKPHLSTDAWIVIICITLIPVIFLVAAAWHAFGFNVTFIAILVILGLVGGWLFIRHIHLYIHHSKDRSLERKEREHTMYLLKEALVAGHSIQMEYPSGHKIATTSPFTIPNGPVTVKEMNVGQAALPAPGVQYPIAPPFASMKSLIRPGRLVLGYNTQGPITGDVSDLLSMAFVGKPGTGKSTGLLYYLAILLLAHASVYVFDPQGSLYEVSDLIPYYGEYDEIYSAIPAIYHELEERENLWRYTKQVRNPLLILVDELPALARYEERMKPAVSVLDLAEKIVTQNRKHNCFAMLTGQSLPANVLPTLTRDNLSSRLVFNSSDMHARMAGLDEDSRKKLLPLLRKAQPGTAILDVSRRPQPDIAALPFTTIDDLRAILDYPVDEKDPTTRPVDDYRVVDQNGWQALPTTPVDTSDAYRFSVDERPVVVELYKAYSNIDKVLRQMQKGSRYHADAARIVREEGL